MPQPTLDFIKRMPKVNLHVHIEGTLLPATLAEIAAKYHYFDQLAPALRQTLQRGVFQFADFPGFIEIYAVCANALREAADYERVTYEYLCRAYTDHIRYVEIYISPFDRMAQGLPFESIIAGAAAGRARAFAELGIRADFVIDVGRHKLWTQAKDQAHARAESLRFIQLAIAAKPQGVIGFSLGGRERGYPLYPFVDAFELARQAGLHTKIHSGEESEADDIWYAIGLLKPERLGNAVHAVNDNALMDHLAAHQIGLELCLTGNVLSGTVPSLAQHPVKAYLKRGLRVAIADDDPALFNTTLTQEYVHLTQLCGLDTAQLQQMVMTQIDLLWLSEPEKAEFRARFQHDFDQLHAAESTH